LFRKWGKILKKEQIMKGLSKLDLQTLSSSPYVSKITDKQIIFTEHFKRLALDSLVEGMTRQEVFNRLLGVNCFDKEFVDNSLARWRRKLRFDGDLSQGKRGRQKDYKNMSFDEMKAEIAYQKEVIKHLKKLRGLADDEI
jgi:hypothetical protein